MTGAVSKFGLSVALTSFCCFVVFLLGAAELRGWLNSTVGPFTVAVWLLLVIHLLPIVFGVVHMRRTKADSPAAQDSTLGVDS